MERLAPESGVGHNSSVIEHPGAYFMPSPDGLVPVPEARSPWADDMLHGRLLAGLAARAAEEAGTDPALRLTRLTVDMFRTPPMTALNTSTKVIRDGRRVRVVEVSIRSEELEVARATALSLRTGPHPPGEIWRAPEWDAPHPETLPAPDGAETFGGWDIRPLHTGGFWTADRKRIWTCDRWQLVAGEPPSPAVRAALASDMPNPLANAGTEGLQFINADLTLFLGRPPVSEWIGLEVDDHLGHEGVAVGTCTLYDTEGAIGWSSVCAIASAPLGE
jgi:hypothetical protein